MRRPGSQKVYETCAESYGPDVLIRPVRRKRKTKVSTKIMNWICWGRR